MTKWVLLVAAVMMAGTLIYVSRGRTSRRAACKVIIAACEQHGFKLGSSREQRREFRDNCLRPILRDGTFRGQEFDPGIVAKCRGRVERLRGAQKS